MKRKIEARIDPEESVLLKSLRKSVSDFIQENETHQTLFSNFS